MGWKRQRDGVGGCAVREIDSLFEEYRRRGGYGGLRGEIQGGEGIEEPTEAEDEAFAEAIQGQEVAAGEEGTATCDSEKRSAQASNPAPVRRGEPLHRDPPPRAADPADCKPCQHTLAWGRPQLLGRWRRTRGEQIERV